LQRIKNKGCAGIEALAYGWRNHVLTYQKINLTASYLQQVITMLYSCELRHVSYWQ